MLPISARVEPVTSWSPVGRRIQLSDRGRPYLLTYAPEEDAESAWASMQSEQSLRCPYEEILHHLLSKCAQWIYWSDYANANSHSFRISQPLNLTLMIRKFDRQICCSIPYLNLHKPYLSLNIKMTVYDLFFVKHLNIPVTLIFIFVRRCKL